jgi:hypothetical protein
MGKQSGLSDAAFLILMSSILPGRVERVVQRPSSGSITPHQATISVSCEWSCARIASTLCLVEVP